MSQGLTTVWPVTSGNAATADVPFFLCKASTTQAALQAEISAGNATILFDPAVTYNFTNLQIDADNVTFSLNGATIRNNGVTPLIVSAGGENFRLLDGTLSGLSSAVDGAYNANDSGIVWTSRTKIFISQVTFKNFKGVGVRIGGQGATADDHRKYIISNCVFSENFIGFINEEDAEFGLISTCMFEACGFGLINTANKWSYDTLTVHKCSTAIVHTSYSSQYHTATGTTTRGLLTNILITNTNHLSAWTNIITIALDGKNYKRIGFLSIGVSPGQITGLGCYFADIFVDKNSDFPFLISSLTIHSGTVNGRMFEGIRISGSSQRVGARLQNNVVTNETRFVEDVSSIVEIVKKKPLVTQLYYSSTLKVPGLHLQGIATAATDFTDFLSPNSTQAAKFSSEDDLIAERRVLFMNAVAGQVAQIYAPITGPMGTDLETYGGQIHVEGLKIPTSKFGHIWFDIPSGNLNGYLEVLDTSARYHNTISNELIDQDTETSVFVADIEIRPLLAGIFFKFNEDETASLPATVNNVGKHSNGDYSNRIAWTSAAETGIVGGLLHKLILTIYEDWPQMTIDLADQNKPYVLEIPKTETRAISLEIPDAAYDEGVGITIQNNSLVDATFVRENNNPAIDGFDGDVTVPAQTTMTIIAYGKGYSWRVQ